MAAQHAIDEADIRQRIDKLVEAVRAVDLEGVKSIYAPDLVSFDIVPPLQHVGAEARLKNWVDVFTSYQRPLGYEIRDLTITLGDEVAFGRSLNRISGVEEREQERLLGSVDDRFSEDRRQLAHRARPGLGASRCGERQSVAESRALTVRPCTRRAKRTRVMAAAGQQKSDWSLSISANVERLGSDLDHFDRRYRLGQMVPAGDRL